jgi:hypothetical protein
VLNFSTNTVLTGGATTIIGENLKIRAPQVATTRQTHKSTQNLKLRHLGSTFLQIHFNQVVHPKIYGERLDDRVPQLVTGR